MTIDPGFGEATEQREREALAGVFASCFNIPQDYMQRFLAAVEPRTLYALRDGADVEGGLAIIRMGQWFGGRSVPCGGIALVGVPPELRARGVGRRLMRSAVRLMRDDGLAISALYPAITPLYRDAGYENAGGHYVTRLDLHRVALRPDPDDGLRIRRATDDDFDAVRALYARCAAQRDGSLDRGPYMWRRVRAWRMEPTDGFACVDEGGALRAYAYTRRAPIENQRYEIEALDLRCETPPAARRMLAFLADHRSMAPSAVIDVPAWDPLVAMLPEPAGAKTSHSGPWMLRILDVRRALEARGYRAGVSGELRLRVRDALLPENDGAWTLRVEGGRGEVREGGGAGGIELDIRALAALYTGFASGESLRERGALQGDERSAALASSIFSGTPPAMSDRF